MNQNEQIKDNKKESCHSKCLCQFFQNVNVILFLMFALVLVVMLIVTNPKVNLADQKNDNISETEKCDSLQSKDTISMVIEN